MLRRGQLIRIKDHWIYFPDFQNERLTGTFKDQQGNLLKDESGKPLKGAPYWSCTFTALMYGVNYAFLGRKPTEISQREIIRLALASGDAKLRGGSNTDEMLKALKKVYGKDKDQETLGMRDVERRLREDKMVVAGLFSTKLNDHFRRFIGNSGANHRAAFVGIRVAGGVTQTRILDPMAVPSSTNYPNPRAWAGEWFPLSDFEKACWPNQQVWFKPGEFLDRVPLHVIRRFSAPRSVTFKNGVKILGYDRLQPDRKVLERTFSGSTPTRAKFDIHLRATTDGQEREYLSIVDGPFAKLLIRRADPGITANTTVATAIPAVDEIAEFPEDIDTLDPTDVPAAGRAAPDDALTMPIDNEIDDDPDDEEPPEEDGTAEPF
jgi:hypothetical protein